MKRLGKLALTTVLFFGAVLALGPLLWAFFQTVDNGPHAWTAYATALRTAPLLRYALNSAFVATLTAFGQTLVSLLAAYAFSRLQFPGRDPLFLLFLAGLFVPAQVTILPSFLILRWLGLIDSYAALVIPSLVQPFTVFLIRQSLLGLSTELEDAGRIDGCSRWNILWHIDLPAVTPALVASVLFSFLWSWNAFLWPLIVLQTPSLYTLPVGLAMLSSELDTYGSVQLAGALMATLPVAVLFLIAQRSIVHAVASGAPTAS